MLLLDLDGLITVQQAAPWPTAPYYERADGGAQKSFDFEKCGAAEEDFPSKLDI